MTSLRTRQRLIKQLQEAGIREQNVLDTLLNVPRHWFVDEALATRAYENTALPIGFGQTISQPYTVARMTELLLADQARPRVLEIGTGSGYQTAVLASLVEQVFSVERIGKLLDRARERLRELGLNNVRLKYDDGLLG
ncbi:MAG: methyltransferase domain-containing protein, partial [Candidatus Competibacteraceae bacterium]|nr:methyltransferase domain-containing protein [Candidatus Competibacteraceae bacterium]